MLTDAAWHMCDVDAINASDIGRFLKMRSEDKRSCMVPDQNCRRERAQLVDCRGVNMRDKFMSLLMSMSRMHD